MHSASLFEPLDTFARRHIGPTDTDIKEMCSVVGVKDLEDLVSKTLPANIRLKRPTKLGPAVSERETLVLLKEIALKNKIMKSVTLLFIFY